jgi:probable addiction module antidote protein
MKAKSDRLKVASSAQIRSSKAIKITTAPFDTADYLDDNETVAAYLSAALTDPDSDVFLVAVKDVARARGMSQLAKDTQLGR